MSKYLREYIKSIINRTKRIFYYKRKHIVSSRKILILGGWGNGNSGDEAQDNATLRLFSERYPDYQIVNLTPDVAYSKKEHPEFYHELASRCLFFNHKKQCNCYLFDKSNKLSFIKVIFLLKSSLIYLNAFLVRAGWPTFFINAEKSKFLYELKHADLLVFGGGGYLTGSTLSRLWEGVLLCKLAEIFKTPVVMSGQTIGVWQNGFNRMLAKWGFKKVKLITVRDREYSLQALKEIGLSGDHIFATHDDALFCDKSNVPQTTIKNYICLNFHYWGMNQNDKKVILEKIHTIVEYILKSTQYHIILIPMHVTDMEAFEDYKKNYPNDRVSCFEYDYDFKKVRRIIADSQMCITMKHHPIIFAMGEDIPTISLAFSEYYEHKNIGALQQYGMEKFSVTLDKDTYFDSFQILFQEISKNMGQIKEEIQKNKEKLIQQKNLFLEKTDKILGLKPAQK